MGALVVWKFGVDVGSRGNLSSRSYTQCQRRATSVRLLWSTCYTPGKFAMGAMLVAVAPGWCVCNQMNHQGANASVDDPLSELAVVCECAAVFQASKDALPIALPNTFPMVCAMRPAAFFRIYRIWRLTCTRGLCGGPPGRPQDKLGPSAVHTRVSSSRFTRILNMSEHTQGWLAAWP